MKQHEVIIKELRAELKEAVRLLQEHLIDRHGCPCTLCKKTDKFLAKRGG